MNRAVASGITLIYHRRTLIIAALVLAALATDASAQQRIFYDASGESLGRAQTDSQGTITFYDARGRVTGRTFINGETATTYDADGRVISRATTTGKHKTIYDAGRPQYRKGHDEPAAIAHEPARRAKAR